MILFSPIICFSQSDTIAQLQDEQYRLNNEILKLRSELNDFKKNNGTEPIKLNLVKAAKFKVASRLLYIGAGALIYLGLPHGDYGQSDPLLVFGYTASLAGFITDCISWSHIRKAGEHYE